MRAEVVAVPKSGCKTLKSLWHDPFVALNLS
jgi:hypothetical protein